MHQRVFSKETRKYFELNEYENTTNENLLDEAKALLGRKFTALKCYYKMYEKKISNQ